MWSLVAVSCQFLYSSHPAFLPVQQFFQSRTTANVPRAPGSSAEPLFQPPEVNTMHNGRSSHCDHQLRCIVGLFPHPIRNLQLSQSPNRSLVQSGRCYIHRMLTAIFSSQRDHTSHLICHERQSSIFALYSPKSFQSKTLPRGESLPLTSAATAASATPSSGGHPATPQLDHYSTPSPRLRGIQRCARLGVRA